MVAFKFLALQFLAGGPGWSTETSYSSSIGSELEAHRHSRFWINPDLRERN